MPKSAKQQYQKSNWKEYNAALKRREKLTFFFDEEVLENWLTKEKTGQRGASPSYTDVAIATMGTIQSLGVKVYKEGEWLVRQHGSKERRTG